MGETDVRYCDVVRQDVEGKDMPACYHPACLFDDPMHYDSVWATRVAACVSARRHAPCDLPLDHAGVHQWYRTDHERYEDRDRHRWLLAHIVGCTACDLYPENNRPIECAELQRYWLPTVAVGAGVSPG